MLTTFLFATTVFLAGVLAFIIYAKHVEVKKHRDEMRRRHDVRWKTVFERTDLRKVS